jgi:hypothetical protein
MLLDEFKVIFHFFSNKPNRMDTNQWVFVFDWDSLDIVSIINHIQLKSQELKGFSICGEIKCGNRTSYSNLLSISFTTNDVAPPSYYTATIQVPATEQVPVPAQVPATEQVPAPAQVPATEQVPAPAQVPATEQVPAPAQVPATEQVPVPAQVPATEQVPVPAQVPATEQVPAPAQVPATEQVPATVLFHFINQFHVINHGNSAVESTHERLAISGLKRRSEVTFILLILGGYNWTT